MRIVKAPSGKVCTILSRTGDILTEPFTGNTLSFNTEEEAQKFIDSHPFQDIYEEEVDELLDDEEAWV